MVGVCPFNRKIVTMSQPNFPQQNVPQPGAAPVKAAKPWYKKWWGIALIVVAVIVVIGMFMPKEDKAKQSAEPSASETAAAASTETSAPATEEASAKESTPAAAETKEADVPREYKSALKKAESYLQFMPFSKAGLYDQLTSENADKFSAEAAQYAVDNVKADWKEQALKAAKNYQDTMNMSPSGIYDQLISEYGNKFTEEEAQYAIDNLPK